MSPIITVWYLKTEEFTWVFDSLDKLIDVVKAEIEGCMCCLGDTYEFTVEQGEMQEHEFENLKEFEG